MRSFAMGGSCFIAMVLRVLSARWIQCERWHCRA
jgi:hypothetical protein